MCAFNSELLKMPNLPKIHFFLVIKMAEMEICNERRNAFESFGGIVPFPIIIHVFFFFLAYCSPGNKVWSP